MKKLSLLRHAKSSWEDAVARDFDRPLNEKGKRAAATIGKFMKREAVDFDLVLASPAVRVVLDSFKFGALVSEVSSQSR